MSAQLRAAEVRDRVAELAAEFAAARPERQQRRQLVQADFDRLRDAGFLLTVVPESMGGLWTNLAASTRPACELLRILAQGDSSVALVAAMHPAVLGFWLATPDVPEPHTAAWAEQVTQVCEAARDGSWWGTITSEPGSGGDVLLTRAVAARAPDGGYRLSGQKHFGSGSGITSYMITSAIPADEAAPDWFYVPVAGRPWDGSAGITLVAEWDGHGMVATQSHGLAFDGVPAVRFAWPGHITEIAGSAGPLAATLFTAVVLGVVQVATDTARAQLGARRDELRPYEHTEWVQAEMEAWLAEQAYAGMLRAIETGRPALGAVLRGKTAVAQLVESCLLRLCRVLGGGTFARRSPFGNWFEDVRALGFLRPPWALAFDNLFPHTFERPPS